MTADPAHDGSEVAKQGAVQRGEGTTGESEFRSAIMGEARVGVLQEGDQDEPVVNPAM